MKKIIIAILFIANFSYAQEKIPFIDYAEIKEQIIKSSSDEEYEKTLLLIDKINKNDSIFYTLLTSKAYYLLQLEKYEEAIKVAEKGIKDVHEDSKVFFYVNKGVAFTNLERYDEAIDTYSQGIKMYPKNYLLHFNKAVVLETQGKLNEAVFFYKESIILNPLNRKPHLQIGNIYYKQERLTQALMCFNLYLLLEPDADGAFEVLKSLNSAVVAKNPNERNIDLELEDADDSYEDIDLVLSSKIAMSEKYETGNLINIALTKQNHAMIEKLKNFDGIDNFWTQKYMPIYNWISENNHFNNFAYTVSYAIENEKYKKIIEKNTENITAFLGAFKTKWVELVSKNKVALNGTKQEVFSEYDGDFVNAIGKKENGISVGSWEFFNESGQLIAIGNFNSEEKKIGEWTWFNYLNKIKETASYKDGKLDGKNFMFYNSEKKYVNANYKNDELEGEYEYFNDKGALMQRKHFAQGMLEGVYTSYFKVGEDIAEFIIPYKNDLVDGEVQEFYANGDMYEKTNYVADKINGVVTKYYHNNKISSEIEYVDGDLNGSYKSYFTSGQISEIGQSIDGFYDGEWKTFYEDGILESEFTYKKGNLDDLYKFYDTDGKLYYEYVYRKGEMISYTFFVKDGAVLKEGKKKGGAFFYEGYSSKGNKTSEGLYDISGGKIGEWKFYTNNGILKGKGNFVENKTDGDYFEYNKNGEIASITPYKEDVLNGYYVNYHSTKKMKSQGWYKNGEMHGEWRYYYQDGAKEAVNFFHKGKLHGVQEYYSVDGTLSSTSKFSFGDHLLDTIFDKDGNTFQEINYTPKENNFIVKLKHFNGNTETEVAYVNGVKHGGYKGFYYNGNKKVTGGYVNGEQNGVWTWYAETGEIESTTPYLIGKVNGKLINYYKNEAVEAEYTYENGVEVGTDIRYYKNGKTETTTQLYKGKVHGRKEFYAPSGKLQLVRFYNHDQLIGYSYLDKNGIEVEMIGLPNETGKITAFYDNGKPSKIMEYKNGDIIHNYKSFFYAGNLEEEMTFLDAVYNGEKTAYFLNGKLKEVSNYVQGDLSGKTTIYYDNGNKKEEKIYLNNLQHGVSNYFDVKGKLAKKKEYINGKIYKVETF
ncbi:MULTISPECIES: tetratricopeptide repeat protein [unclassified Polaribacter]|uniref:tetratricopeptide repeat protein n=1 Tax=unclassified Polaribacter TaxID=196858 RepID=UPI0011BEF123|nr:MULTISPECIES: tetratricopeptide repeat protein [unclassified Polaribacter]TXD53395.1 hypothetical protein ES043_04120 [Polaribacter sp. IC063]TXD61503.1 hypothetical protein ES044_04710 [Polaribacter sp. IC066]